MPRPRITLKLATSLDGKIALANGQSEWITGEKARAEGRRLRARHDAIAVGANTAVLDNPQLTSRILGEPDPHRVIFDSRIRLSLNSNIALTAKQNRVTLFCEAGYHESEKVYKLEELGVRVLHIGSNETGLDVLDALNILHNLQYKSLLLEGGGTLTASFLKANVIDIIEWFRAPLILGGDGRSGIGELGLTDLNMAQRFNRINILDLGDDIHERYERVVD